MSTATVLRFLVGELFCRRKLPRTPETMTMEEPANVGSFHAEGDLNGYCLPVYHFNAIMMSELAPANAVVLDLGSGSGQYLRYFARFRPDVRIIGLDLSEAMVELGRRSLRSAGLEERVELRVGDMTDFARGLGRRIDLLSSVFALHHLPDQACLHRAIAEIARVREECGCGVWLFDLARPRSAATPPLYPRIFTPFAAPEFKQDSINSLRAAWSFGELRDALREACLGAFQHNRLHLFLHLYQSHSLPRKGVQRELQVAPTSSFKTAELIALATVKDVEASALKRAGRLAATGLKIAAVMVRSGAASLGRRPAAELAHQRRRAMKKIGRILRTDLGLMKGPLMKFGQILSYVAEDLPAPIRRNLGRLQEQSQSLDPAVTRALVESELGQPIDALFSDWQNFPLAAASISQIHGARLRDGTAVIVKVRYPRIERAVAADLKLLKAVLPLIAAAFKVHNARELFEELQALILAECDFRKEAQNQHLFRQCFAGDPEILIPQVFPELCSKGVLVMERVTGQRYLEFRQTASQEEKNRAGEILWRMAATSVNRYSIFNGDPHPGNYLFLPGRVGFLDFGFVKKWPLSLMNTMKRQTLAAVEHDFESFSACTRALGFVLEESGFNYREMARTFLDSLYRPYREDCRYRFAPALIKEELRDLMKSPSFGLMVWPRDYLALIRLFGGLNAVLADLGAEANWHRIVMPLLREPTQGIDRLEPLQFA